MNVIRLRRRWWLLGACATLLAGCWALTPHPLFAQEDSTMVLDRNDQFVGAMTASDQQWRLPAADSIPDRFAKALLVAEDRRFYWHLGIDPWSVGRAIRDNFRHGRIVGGGSTLTQQLARMSLRSHGAEAKRSWSNKVHEAGIAFWLELTHHKSTLLALYANHAPFGGNVVGLEAASWRWYGKDPAQLSWGEAAALAALPNAPASVHPGRGRDRLLARRDRILSSLLHNGTLDSVEWSLARSEPLPSTPLPLPNFAPHLTAWLQDVGRGTRWHTTLDMELQQNVMRLAREQLQQLTPQGISGLAVMVVELRGKDSLPAVRAWIGDAGTSHQRITGTDLALAPRSTGSTLKPFLYAQLLDAGQILPKQWIEDLPSRWGDFRPQNASLQFEGMVPADEALVRSLNVPWARQLQTLGVAPFHALLREGGLTHLFRTPEEYGIPLVLGGAEANLAELVGLYAALGRGGNAAPLVVAQNGSTYRTLAGPSGDAPSANSLEDAKHVFRRRSQQPLQTRQILSQGASWLTLEALRKPGRIDEERYWQAWAQQTPVAWKTGTSFGHRDAWALGVTPRWVIGVWAGNASGEGRPHLWGSEAAAPLLFRILPMLDRAQSASWFGMPNDLVSVPVCAQTGTRRSSHCPNGGTVPSVAAGLRTPIDRLYSTISVNEAGERVNSSCSQTSLMRRISVLKLSPASLSFLRQAHPERAPEPPIWASGCTPDERTSTMEILIPEHGSRITLPVDLDGSPEKLVIDVRHQNPNAQVRCFLNKQDLGESDRFHTFAIQPRPGDHSIVCTDPDGNQARSRFKVEWTSRRNARKP